MPAPAIAKTIAPPIVVAPPDHAQRVYDTLTLAFAADPPNRWVSPQPDQYLRNFPKFARALGGNALAHDTAFVTQDYSAVALWLPPGVSPDEQALHDLFSTTVAAEKKADLFGAFEQMGRLHPKEPHWYLPFIGVDPARQGQGLGAALLQATLARCDAEHLPAYLESSNPRNIPFYERHGFRAVGEIKAGTCPPVTPMLRSARR